MGGYNDLKTAIAALIHTNDNQEITGATLQSALLSIINTIGQGSVFKGVATTSTNPGSPDANVFYIAGRPGYYPNFNLELTAGLHVIENKSSTWVNTEIVLDVVDAINIGGAKHVKPSQAMLINLQSIEQIPDSEGLNNKMWWSTDGNLKYKQNDTVYNLGAPAYVLYYCGDKIYKWTGSGFREIGGGGTFASGEAVSNMSIFDDGGDTDGKSSAQLAAMIPSGEVIKSLLEIISSIETSGGSYDGVDLITTFSYDAPTRVITVKQSGRQAKTILLPLANSTNAGLMSSEDKTRLANLQNLIGKTVKSFNKSTGENGITITLTTYDNTPYTVLIPNSEIDPSTLAGKADKHVAADILAPSQWPRVMLYNIESMWGAGGTPPDYASIPVGSIYLDDSSGIDDPPYRRLFYKKTLEGTSQRIDLGAPQENTIYCHVATGKLYRWIPTQNGNDGAFQQVGADGKSAYQSYLDTTSDNPKMSEAEWVASLKGEKGDAGNVHVTDGVADIDIINDLSTGGVGDALSAEMGLRLKSNIDAVQANIVKLYAKLANMAFWDSTDHGDAEPTALDWSIPKVTATITNSIGANAVIKKNGSVVGSSVQVDQGSPLVLTIEAATGYELSNVAATIGGVAQTLTENNGVYTLSIDHVNSSITIAITGSASMLWHTMAKTNVEDGNGNVVEYGIQQGRSINPTTLDVTAGLSGSTPLVVLAPLGNPTNQYIMTTNTNLTGPGNAEPYFIPTFGKRYLHFKMSGGTLSSGQVPKICIACYKESIVDGFSYSQANVQSRGITRIPYQAANNGDMQWKVDLFNAVNNPTGGSAGSPVAGDIKFVKVMICVYPNGTSTNAVDSRTWFDNFSFAYKITDD